MMFLFIGQDSLKQSQRYIVTFFFCSANDLPAQLNGPSFLLSVILFPLSLFQAVTAK
jgi:hypothetical protein